MTTRSLLSHVAALTVAARARLVFIHKVKRTLNAAVIAAALVLVAFASLAGQARAAYPGASGALGYTSSGGVQSEGYGTVALSLWAMNPDGSAQQAIHQNYVGDPLEIVPVWSPNGTLIAYTRCAAQLFGCDASQEVWLRNADGSNPRRVTTGTQPSWTPDGQSLVVTDKYYFPVGEPANQLYRVNLDGSGKTLLTEPDSCGKGLPKVSPQGDRVAFQWSCPYLDKVTGVYAVPIGGGSPVRLTPWTDYERQDGFDWSPDGQRIVYSRAPNGWPVPTHDLFVVELSTGGARRLTTTDATGPDFPPDEGGPAFSPDGSKIAYHRQGDIWLMNADGSDQRQLTRTTWSETWPNWQPCIAGVTRKCVLTPPPISQAPQPPTPQPPSPAPPPGSPPPPSPGAGGSKGSGGAAGANRLLVDSFSAPKKALAGRLFVARLLVKNADGSSLAKATVSCKAKMKERSVKVLSRGVRAGRAFCTWRVPAARRKAFTGTIRVTAAGAKVTRTFRRVIR